MVGAEHAWPLPGGGGQSRRGGSFFPWVFGIFIVVLLANLWEVIPGVETIGLINHEIPGCENAASADFFLVDKSVSNCITPLLRPPSTDLNFTLAIAVISVVVTQIYGWRMLGAKAQLGRYLTLRDGVIGLFVGLLEAVLELARIISFGFRLFGNLFAGSVLLLVISFLLPFVGAIPFYFLEIFVAFIQAFVFAMLTLIFLTLGTTGHGHEDAEEDMRRKCSTRSSCALSRRSKGSYLDSSVLCPYLASGAASGVLRRRVQDRCSELTCHAPA